MCTHTQSTRRESSGASHRKCVTPVTTGQQAGGGRETATFTFTSRQSDYFICAIKTHKQIRHHAKRSLSQCVGSSLATLSAPGSVSSWLLSRFSWKRTPFPSNCPLPPPEDQCSFGVFLLPRPRRPVLEPPQCGVEGPVPFAAAPQLVPPAAHGAPSAGGNAECPGPLTLGRGKLCSFSRGLGLQPWGLTLGPGLVSFQISLPCGVKSLSSSYF